MNALCAICQDILEPSNDIHMTPCGHVFHFPCLNLWLDKSQTCPQCRQKVKRDRITRIFFNFSNTEAIKEDSFTLQQKVDSLMFQVKLKETECNKYKSDSVTFKQQASKLRDEMKKVESEINQKNSVIHALKEQSLYFKDKCKDYETLHQEKKKLEGQLEKYENVKSLICSTSEDVDQMLSKTTDATTLSVYVSIMKRELNTSVSKRKELRSTVKRLQHDLQTLKKERNSFSEDYVKRIEQLEDELEICKSERDVLKKRLNKLESGNKQSDKPEVPSKSTTEATSEAVTSRKREMDISFEIDTTSSKKLKQTTDKFTESSFSPKENDDSDVVLVTSDTKKTKENEENSPYLPTKSKSILGLKERPLQRGGRKLSILSKRILASKKSDAALLNSRRMDSSLVFDGFGGHSKLETFPKSSPSKKRPIDEPSRMKKLKLDLRSNKQMDDYIINLT